MFKALPRKKVPAIENPLALPGDIQLQAIMWDMVLPVPVQIELGASFIADLSAIQRLERTPREEISLDSAPLNLQRLMQPNFFAPIITVQQRCVPLDPEIAVMFCDFDQHIIRRRDDVRRDMDQHFRPDFFNPHYRQPSASASASAAEPSSAGTNAAKLLEWGYAGDIPDEFICPITLEIFTDPVTVSAYSTSGRTYEKAWLIRWVREHQKCPLTNLPVPVQWINDLSRWSDGARRCTHNTVLKAEVEKFMQAAQEQACQQENQIIPRNMKGL